jgi:hypothetical protein
VSGGGYIVVGKVNFGNLETGVWSSDAWLAKLDDAGNIEWQRLYRWGSSVDVNSVRQSVHVNRVRPTTDGNYVLAGRVWTPP